MQENNIKLWKNFENLGKIVLSQNTTRTKQAATEIFQLHRQDDKKSLTKKEGFIV